MADTHYDVIIIGAGVSGIGMACHLHEDCPEKRFAILERRADLGGTWDLFKYPGIRSDSDMLTFGYRFKPWVKSQLLADGPSIKQYVRKAAREHDIESHIQLSTSVDQADWSNEHNVWTLTTRNEQTGENETVTCNFLVTGTGYYRYSEGYRPDFPGEEHFKGRIIHPQQWPDDLDYRGKRVVVIGSGATAVTLIPAMAPDVANITMLQRSPSYILPIPANDKLSDALAKVMPQSWVYQLSRKRNITLQRYIYNACKRWPNASRRVLHEIARASLGLSFDMSHFQPHYNPWDERLCVIPNADLYRVLARNEANIETDHIETFTENGIRLQSGKELEADIVICATGLHVQMLGGMTLTMDGQPIDITQRMMYKATMIEGLPNFATVFGYINASWTLKADIVSQYVCRLLQHMDAHGHNRATPVDREGCQAEESMLDVLKSGYARRAGPRLPRQGTKPPWQVSHDYHSDRPLLTKAPIDDGILELEDYPTPDEKAKAA